jgi:hypothetical protein
MAFLTGTASLVSIVFAWSFVVLFAKGWATECRLDMSHRRRSITHADSNQAESVNGLGSPAGDTLSN